MQWLRLWLHVARNERAAADLVWENLAKLPAAGVAVHAPFNHPVIVHLIDRGETEAVLERIRGWRAATTGMRSFRLDYEFDVMEAYARLLSNDLHAGLPRMHAAFATAGKHELISNFAWVSRMMAYLCARAREHGIEADYGKRVALPHRIFRIMLAHSLALTSEDKRGERRSEVGVLGEAD